MELKEFITSTLDEIQQGVQAAINQTIESGVGGAINPNWNESNNHGALIQKINFDIAVTVADEENSGTKGGIKVVGLSIGGEESASSKISRISRIQFSIPIIPPVTKVTE